MSPPGGAAGWRGPCPTGRLKKKVSREDGRGDHEQDREAARPVTSSRHGVWSGGGLKIDCVGRTFFCRRRIFCTAGIEASAEPGARLALSI